LGLSSAASYGRLRDSSLPHRFAQPSAGSGTLLITKKWFLHEWLPENNEKAETL
jgi:hypothetical protein